VFAARERTLVPTSHPPIPSEPSLLWLAPTRNDRVSLTPATTRFASGIDLYQKGKYADALRLLSSRSSLPRPAADYASYYTAQTQLKLGRPDVARREFAALSARTPVGYLWEAALIGEAEAAAAAGDHASARRLYERLLTRTPMAPDDAWFRSGRAAQAAGNVAGAIAAFTHLYEQFPLSRYTPDAMSALSALQGLDPLAVGNARYRFEFQRAALLFNAKRYEEARVAFERLRPYASGVDRERADVRMAVCYYFARQYTKTRTILRPYRDRAAAFEAEARFFDLMSARALGYYDEFERLADEFLAKFPGTMWAAQALDTLGTHYIQRDRAEDADIAFRRVLVDFPGGRYAERAAWKVGWRAYRLGNIVETVEIFERAATRFPRSDYRPAYLYWAARARQLLGEHETAVLRYALVRTDYLHSYYGRLADARFKWSAVPLRAAFVTNARPSSGVAAEIETAPIVPTAEIIRLLLSLSLYDDALNEIRYAKHRWGDLPLLQATIGWIEHQRGDVLAGARAAKRAYPQYISEAGEALPPEITAVIFPVGYWSLLQEHAGRYNLDPYLIAALVAQESGFVPDIRSSAKATGLMQLMPATAQRYARKVGVSSYSTAMLTRPDTNVRLGIAYFADLMQKFGEAHFALASYNAGETRVRRWVSERPDLSPDEFIDDIPFPETQNYVKKILGAAENYRRVYGTDDVLPVDPDRAIPSLASRRAATVLERSEGAVPRAASASAAGKAKRAPATAQKARPVKAGSAAKSKKATSARPQPARTSTPRSGAT
jgi:soluble lytic murein transglycosylase